MKNTAFTLIVVFFISFFACNSQEKKEQENTKSKKKDTIINPKVNWDVQKEYDEFGNLIKYDSIYTYSYSNINGDTIKVNLDSIMNSFKGYFKQHTPFKFNEQFSYFPQNDSLFMKNFFNDNYFFNQWSKQPIKIDEMLHKMDSMRNTFLKKYYPELLEGKKIK